MNLLRKMLWIVVIAIFAGNVEGITTFDLPNNTPSLHDKGRVALHNGVQCIRVTINKNNIYFPADGHQPTIAEAVEYSCADIDNEPNSPITTWYMMMFGVLQNGSKYIQAGYDKFRAVRIISCDQGLVDVKAFKSRFRKIASTTTGRVLLYRILLEIRRRNGHNQGVVGSDVNTSTYMPRDWDMRNAQRSITISNGDFSFHPSTHRISIKRIRNNALQLTTIGNDSNPPAFTNIVLNSIDNSSAIALYHEMLHWFHALRDICRLCNDNNINNFQINEHCIGRYYWGALLGAPLDLNKIENSGCNWHGTFDFVDFEEMRTILGMPEGTTNYLAGDELCENLYRFELGSPLRYGYTDKDYVEDTLVINQVIAAIRNSAMIMNINNNLNRINKTLSQTRLGELVKEGLGNCKVD